MHLSERSRASNFNLLTHELRNPKLAITSVFCQVTVKTNFHELEVILCKDYNFVTGSTN